MPLAPPPDGAVFPTWADCLRAVQSLAAVEGYAVNSKGQAKNKDTGLYRRYVIRCDKSGAFKSAAQIGTRRVSSKKTDCPFSAACNIRPNGCFLRVLVPDHNHPPSALPAAHVQHRKLTDEQRHLVETRAVERKSIKLIWQELRDLDPTTHITFKDVDNAVQRFRKKAKDGATGVQAIMYKLVERQDLFCFTLEREGAVQGAFWVPHWSADLWMRPNGTPDILIMLTEHIANRPVLPILEMNSVLNTAGFGGSQSTRAMPADPVNPVNPNIDVQPNTDSSPTNLATDNSNSSASPAPFAPNLPSTASGPQNIMNDMGKNNRGLDATLGAGYAILPDKSNATLLWLQSAVELLRQRLPQFSKGGIQHRQMHIVFGRILTNDEDNQAHHGVRTRKPRVERRRSDGMAGHGEEVEDNDEDREQADGEGEQEQEGGENDDEDQDMDGDHDSDAEIARQLTGGHAYNGRNDQDPHGHHTSHNNHNQNPSHVYNQNDQPSFDHPQPRGPNSTHMPGRLPLPAHAPRHPSMQAQPPAQMTYDAMMGRMPGGLMPNHQSRPMQ
ncbi:hypothetical protein GQX73_g3579 [Xylaria multiplex]|uniref:FAR1 domain-containing protein n=1 Tax=Xylaria multiplex TaxID=323545 RepID=A0A7C8IVB6_9PEZI|nr:hypothetical protein GQX73_g3579 [Xylaria multiplex]